MRAEVGEQRRPRVGETQSLSDGRQQQVGIRRRGEVDEERTVIPLRLELGGDRERQARLAGAARPDQRDEPRLAAKECGHGGHLEPPADERRRGSGKPARRDPVRSRTAGERRVVPQHRALELLQRGRRLHAELVHPCGARRTVCLQRLGLPAGAVERQDQLPAQPLAVGMPLDQLLELGDDELGPAEREPRVDPQLDRLDPLFLQPLRGRARRLVEIHEPGERWTAPQPDRLVERVRGLAGTSACERLMRLGDQAPETLEVELARLDVQPVGAAPGHDPLGAERLAQPVDVDLQRADRGLRRPLAPDRVDELAARHGLVRAQQQIGEDGALLRAAERQRPSTEPRLERPEQQELHGYPCRRQTPVLNDPQADLKRSGPSSPAT